MAATDFRNVISNVADAIVIVDQEGIIRFANPSTEALFGRNVKELLGKQFGFPCVTDQTTEIEVISKSGERRTAEMRMTETVWEGKRSYLASIRDFTELKRLEQELRKQAHDLAGRVKELSCLYSIRKLIERPRVSFEEIARDIMALIPPGWQYPEITCARIILNDQAFATENFKETNWKQTSDISVHGKQAGVLEVNYLEERPESDEGLFSKGERRLIDAITERLEHVLERIKAEEELRESEEKYRVLFESAGDAIFLHDTEARMLAVNSLACERLGYTHAELMSMRIIQVDSPEEGHHAPDRIARLIAQGHLSFETVHQRKDGSHIPTEVSARKIIWDGQPAMMSICRDITERKRAEEEKVRLQSQLQQSQKMEAVGSLAGGIAHDFNNILAVILGNAELAADDVPDWNPASVSLKEIRRASIRAKDMVQQLLAFSRKTDEKSKPIDMAPIIKESLAMLKHAIPTSVEFEQHISDDQCSIMGDASQINQIVMNLVTNAADAMSERGGLLEVTLENIIFQEEKICFGWVLSPGPYVRLRMRDTGEGIEPEIIDRIFDPYYTTKEVGKGTGMGLSVIHGIVKRHNGGIRVESELGKGTFFEIYFPALEKAAEEEKKPEGEIKGGSERILFVDDEESMVNLNHQRLERLGYNVKSTTKPVEALEWFRADPGQFDVIITDMTMPRMTGDRLASEVLKIRPHMPVIICTGYSERMSAKKAEALGVRKYIEKPIDLRNLASSLREVLDGK